MKHLAIFGAGTFGREVAWLVREINSESYQWDFIGFFDNDESKFINQLNYLGTIEQLNNWPEELYVVVAIGNATTKRNLISEIRNPNIKFATLIHPNVRFDSRTVTFSEGCIICAGCILTVDCFIGRHVIINLACTVGHDAVIGSYSSLMPSVNISGEVTLGESVYIGTGAKIINQLEIGQDTIVGAGAVVSKSLPAFCTAVGVPAKPIKFHTPIATEPGLRMVNIGLAAGNA